MQDNQKYFCRHIFLHCGKIAPGFMLTLHHTLKDCISALREQFPQTPFLTLGQTVFWDEPLKAAFCRALEQLAPQAAMIAAIHNTDYFAKLPGGGSGPDPFLLLPHNDGSTRELWSAAGEISCLFGSETVPTRQKLTANGVAFDRLARRANEDAAAFLDEHTTAWGWRALVQTDSKSRVANDILLRDIYPALRRQLEWAFDESLQILGQTENAVTTQMLDWLDAFYAEHPDASLTACYQFFTPKLWALVRGEAACPLETGSTTELLRFNKSTFALPRFGLVELFLNPATRETARRCYNEAVQNSGIYQLEQFGAGALPFDVVIPGQGRGTLRLHQNNIIIETEKPQVLCSDCNPETLEQLANILESTFGPDVTLVGKAVTLISMLGAEFIFVFHEKASSYTAFTQKMNQSLRAAGMELALHPMLRLRYSTWDSLSAAGANFTLPPHLADAFETPQISAAQLAHQWQNVCDAQDDILQQLASRRAPRDLLAWLAVKDHDWDQKLSEYDARRQQMNTLRGCIEEHKKNAGDARAQAQQASRQSVELETAQGKHWRAELLPIKRQIEDIREAAFHRQQQQATQKLSKTERAAEQELRAREEAQIAALKSTFAEHQIHRQELSDQIDALRATARTHRTAASASIAKQAALEKSPEMQHLRQTLRALEDEAETERLRRVQNAILTSEGLRYTNYRPTAWWLPLVSPDHKWFEELVSSAQARVEEL